MIWWKVLFLGGKALEDRAYGVRVRVQAMVRVRFTLCSFGFSFIEYIHATSFSMWSMVKVRVMVRVMQGTLGQNDMKHLM